MIVDKILRIIYPINCIFWDKELEEEQPIEVCEECYKELKFLYNSNTIHKRDYNIYYDDIFATFEYEGIIKESIKRYKYQHKAYLFRTFKCTVTLAKGMAKRLQPSSFISQTTFKNDQYTI